MVCPSGKRLHFSEQPLKQHPIMMDQTDPGSHVLDMRRLHKTFAQVIATGIIKEAGNTSKINPWLHPGGKSVKPLQEDLTGQIGSGHSARPGVGYLRLAKPQPAHPG